MVNIADKENKELEMEVESENEYDVDMIQTIILKKALEKAYMISIKAENHLKQKEELENRKIEINQRVQEIKEEGTPLQEKLLLIGIPFSIIGSLLFGVASFSDFMIMLIFIAVFYYLIITQIVNKIIYLFTRKDQRMQAEKYYIQAMTVLEEDIEKWNIEYQKNEKEKREYAMKLGVPEKYCNSSILTVFLQIIEQGNFSDMAQVILCYQMYLEEQEEASVFKKPNV